MTSVYYCWVLATPEDTVQCGVCGYLIAMSKFVRWMLSVEIASSAMPIQ